MKHFLLCVLIQLGLFTPINSQNNVLYVNASDKNPLEHVQVFNSSNTLLGETNSHGIVRLSKTDLNQTIILKKIGFKNLSLTIQERTDTIHIVMYSNTIKEVEITSKSTKIQSKVNTETIDKCELGKLACCNLAESFENSNTVDVVYSDGITGGREIQMLGLAGVYSQQLMEGTAYHRGILSKLGLELVPGPWIESIGINKGIGSVANGFENITGQINIEFKKPKKSESLFVNGYISEIAKSDFNIIKSFQLKDNLYTNIMGHTSFSRTKMDNNNDYFIDMPQFININFMNKWQYFADNGFVLNASIQAAKHQIDAGQLHDNPHQNIVHPYIIHQDNTELQAMLKTGWELDAVNETSFALISRFNLSKSSGNYGTNSLLNNEIFANLTSIYQTKWTFIESLSTKLGYSFHFDEIAESYHNLNFQKRELVHGLFMENNYTDEYFTAIVGLRADYHHDLGLFFSPRASVSFFPSDVHVLKLSAGFGFRTPSILTESGSYLMSNRTVSLPQQLQAEKAFNSGISYKFDYKLFGSKASFEASYFLTLFKHQLLFNLEKEGVLSVFYSEQESRAQNIQIEHNWTINKNISLKLSYKNDVNSAYYDQIQKSLPLVKTDKFLSNLTLTSTNQKWRFSNTILINGPARIPNISMETHSPWHPIVHSQINFVPNKQFDFYIGAENIFSYTQQNRIISYQNTHDPTFDASMIWGPLDNRRMYIGFKYSIE